MSITRKFEITIVDAIKQHQTKSAHPQVCTLKYMPTYSYMSCYNMSVKEGILPVIINHCQKEIYQLFSRHI